MNSTFSKDTSRYSDPMAPRIEAALKHREALEAGYPSVSNVYDGFYSKLADLSRKSNRFFLGAEALIGSRLYFESNKSSTNTLQLFSSDGLLLAQLSGTSAERLAAHASQGWHIEPFISTIYYQAKEKKASADIAFICWAPLDTEQNAALQAFSRNIAERIASGDRADLRLSQDQFISVLRSGGSWYLTPKTKREPLQKGTIVYKNHRSGTERIAAFALGHRTGCSILASIFWLVVAVGIGYLVWSLFFAG